MHLRTESYLISGHVLLIRWRMLSAIRRHKPGERGPRICRGDPGGCSLAWLRLGRPARSRIRLFPKASRLCDRSHPGWESICG